MSDAGKRFGQLVVLGGEGKHRECLCDCGLTKRVRIDHLRGEKIRSCGCLRDRLASLRAHKMHEANEKHGLCKTPIYGIWRGIRTRCENPRNPAYRYYGGRGIAICEAWKASVETFARDMGPRPSPQHTVERRDNNGNYEPSNCYWATRTEQQNNLRSNRKITFNGATHTIGGWSTLLGLHRNTITDRFDRGLPLDEVFRTDRPRKPGGLAWGSIANAARQRAKTHCKRGHPFNEANTAWTSKNSRVCRTCDREREAARRTPIRAIAGRGQRE